MKNAPPFTVVYEDADVIAVNKASGISTAGERWDAAAPRLDKLIGGRLYVVHRIDKETSGLVLFAKTEDAHRRLCGIFERREAAKIYIAIANGKPAWRQTLCELSLVPDGNKKHQTIIDQFRGKKSVTRFTALMSAGNYTVVRAEPETGRTHQIRVSLASLGHPAVCDTLYGGRHPLLLSEIKHGWHGDKHSEQPLVARLALHAALLSVPGLPSLEAPLHKDMKAALHQFEKNGVIYEENKI
ncbi:MAG: RluA family pseudouridine synthase [Spirochaetaceae bacterium]|jgi:23S rRNA pseudouridine1911/1915/1917 synthase|nr:RluA family pseudouridine synthase [Spirochaetaceae bacterium]